MLSNPALDVVIGLIFIYLLYSLYATVIMEIIASSFGLRARNLHYAISRMLMDEKKYNRKIWKIVNRWLTSLSSISGYATNLKHPVLFKRFLEQPAIKYLGNGGVHSKPSYLTAENFSRSLTDALQIPDTDISQLSRIKEGLLRLSVGHELRTELIALFNKREFSSEEFIKGIEQWYNNNFKVPEDSKLKKKLIELVKKNSNDPVKLKQQLILWTEQMTQDDIGPETRRHIISLLEQADEDLIKFRILVEHWFNEMMERSTGWYKRSTQMILFIVGCVITYIFNVDTMTIIQKLSIDKDAREKMVAMATEFTEKNQTLINDLNKTPASDSTAKELNERLNQLNSIRARLENDMNNTQSILSSTWHLPDKIKPHHQFNKTEPDSIDIIYNSTKDSIAFLRVHKSIDANLFIKSLGKSDNAGSIAINQSKYKRTYIFSGSHVWGYLLTVLALSLGAPFWFDLLNKLVKLRSSKASSDTTTTSSRSVVKEIRDQDILNRVG